MRILIALGGNALLPRGAAPDALIQVEHVAEAAPALARIGTDHELVITHGNGPQVGLLALESSADATLSRPYPLDALVAETQGMIGYWLQQSLANAGLGRPVVSLVSQTVVAADDPAWTDPTKFVGATYGAEDAAALAAERGWQVRPDGEAWRRVVASPKPTLVVEAPIVRGLLDDGTVVICAGGGGCPVVERDGRLEGVEAVVDKDLASALLAIELDADRLIMLTDVDALYEGFGTPDARPIRTASAAELRATAFAAGSMGPKVDAACTFAERTGRSASIGALADLAEVLAQAAGTTVTP